jgi:hypothetical protein
MEAPEVRIVETSEVPTAVIRASTTWEAYPALWPQLLGEVWTLVRERQLPAGRNVMRYLDGVPNVEVGVELDGFEAVGRIVPSTLPAARAALAIAPGEPTRDGIAAAHDAVHRYCDAQGLVLDGSRWEIYSHQREDVTLQTEVYWSLDQGRSPH